MWSLSGEVGWNSPIFLILNFPDNLFNTWITASSDLELSFEICFGLLIISIPIDNPWSSISSDSEDKTIFSNNLDFCISKAVISIKDLPSSLDKFFFF